MSWNVIEHKMNSVRTGLNQWELKSLEREFSEIANRVPRLNSIARSIRGVLFVDLVYGLARHRDWLQVPVLSALLVDFLQLDHGIPRADAEILIHDMIEVAVELGLSRVRSICCDDREFLTWAYVCAAGARDEDALEADLGLGTAVLRKLREGLQAIERVDSQVFIPEYDAMLAAIVLELGHECKSTPWAMDYHRLRYVLLAAAGDAAQPFILEESLPVLFESLVQIGFGRHDVIQNRPSLCEILISAGIICENSGSRRGKKLAYELTDLGARLTAVYVAMTQSFDEIEDCFSKMNNRWQEAVIRRSHGLSFETLLPMVVDGINKLSPDVTEAVIARMLEIDPSRLTGDVVRAMLKKAQMGWHKAAIMRALRKVKPSRDLLDAVASELTSSMSPGVRLAAGGLLDNWTD
jgi:hypothetical protein